VVVFIGLAACAEGPIPEQDAVLVNPTPTVHSELTRLVSAAISGTDGRLAPVTLADSALTESSSLTIEPVQLRDPQGYLANGRETRLPENFRLVRVGTQCVLIRERTGQRFTIPDAVCFVR
jgi:hypothetical protein